jgi:hypothetical protein
MTHYASQHSPVYLDLSEFICKLTFSFQSQSTEYQAQNTNQFIQACLLRIKFGFDGITISREITIHTRIRVRNL